MDRTAAREKIKGIVDVLEHAMYAIDNETKYQQHDAKQATAIGTLQKESANLKTTLWQNQKLLRTYREYSTMQFAICPECNGMGGHEWETPEGVDGEPCNLCQESGIVTEEVEADWKASRAVPIVQASSSTPTQEEADSDLPF